jgi:hypothetical protein
MVTIDLSIEPIWTSFPELPFLEDFQENPHGPVWPGFKRYRFLAVLNI